MMINHSKQCVPEWVPSNFTVFMHDTQTAFLIVNTGKGYSALFLVESAKYWTKIDATSDSVLGIIKKIEELESEDFSPYMGAGL